MCVTSYATNMQPSEEIKQKLDIVDFIRDYVPLKAAGMNFRGLCPFHREKTPSFMVSPDKQIWHCFGCGKGGDIFTFLMEMEGIEFVEALRILAPKAGVTLKRQDPRAASQRNRTLDILELSRRYYHKLYLESNEAKTAREYLNKRGLKEETIEEWQIGYSPDKWEAVLNLLKQKGFKEEEIFKSGMIVRSAKKAGFYDRFRDRIMFPINDVNSNTVAFSARVNPAKEETEKMGKYINSPQSQVYDKSRIIFGLDKAKQAIKQNGYAILVEGQMDAISAHQAGFKNTVASSGTALTTDQISLLKRYSPNIMLAFDMDEAGVMAADRGIREALSQEMNIKVIELPEGKDPDDCIRENKDDFKKAIENAKPLLKYYFDRIFKDLDLGSVDNRREAARKLLPIIVQIGNRIEQDMWLRELSGRINVKEEILRESLLQKKETNRRVSSGEEVKASGAAKSPPNRDEKVCEIVLALMIKMPSLIEYVMNHLQVEEIHGHDNKSLYKNIIFYYNNAIDKTSPILTNSGQDSLMYQDFKAWLDKGGSPLEKNEKESQLSLLNRLAFLGDRDYYNFDSTEAKNELIGSVHYLKERHLKSRMKEIEQLIADSERRQDEQASRDLMEEFKLLSEELRELSSLNQ
jgi:DNA primase